MKIESDDSNTLLLDFYKPYVFYSLNCKLPSKVEYVKKKGIPDDEFKISGYAIEHKLRFFGREKKLFALFVRNEEVYFLAGRQCFNVTSNEEVISRQRLGLFKYRLYLTSKNVDVALVEFYEYAKTNPGDMDANFFVDVLHWLKNSNTKKALKNYWKDCQRGDVSPSN